MKIGIIVAMEKELRLLLPLLEGSRTQSIDGFELHTGTVGPHEVCAMKCGIGKVNAALGCQTLIKAFAPGLVINTGVAGGAGGRADVLDVAVATAIGYHDVWCGPGQKWGQVEGLPELFACDAAVLGLPVLKANPKVKFGIIASGDVFVNTRETVDRIRELYTDVVGIDMESGSIAHTCFHFGVPFVCLRVISDTPGQVSDNGAQYASFWAAAPEETFAVIKDMLEAIDL